MGEGGKEEQGSSQDNLKRAQELVESQKKGTVINTPEGTAVDIHGVSEIVEGKEQISLLNTKKGDIAWWTTESGSSGYYMVDIPPSEGPDEKRDYGTGEIAIIRPKDHPVGNQQGKGIIHGAQIGSILAMGKIIKGQPLEYFITIGDKLPKRYETTNVVDMGIINSETLKKN